MIRRFWEVPREGVKVDEEDPLIGWRVDEVAPDGRLRGVGRDCVLRADRCTAPTGRLVKVRSLVAHVAPHPNCECGPRLLGDVQALSKFWGDLRDYSVDAGLRWAPPGSKVVGRYSAMGRVCPGYAVPVDDPPTTIRIGAARLLAVFASGDVDVKALRRTYPDVPVRPASEIPDGAFGWLADPGAVVLQATPHRRHITVRTGAATLEIPRSWLEPPAVREAIWKAIGGEWAMAGPVSVVAQRVVYPLTVDELNYRQMLGVAFGVCIALGNLPEIEFEL
ncbi:hypothetical protein GCM10027060_18880 [Nesterenkonia halophila]